MLLEKYINSKYLNKVVKMATKKRKYLVLYNPKQSKIRMALLPKIKGKEFTTEEAARRFVKKHPNARYIGK